MKRIVVLINGTWNKEGTTGDTNVAKMDSANRIVANAFIRNRSTDGTLQRVRYHDGVGTDGDIFKKILGGAIGLGLKKIILDCYGFLVDDYDTDDEIYIFGFSRGAYAVACISRVDWRNGHLAPHRCRVVRGCLATLSSKTCGTPTAANGERN
jgi:uncharacterized protein (DUF2235 family)